MCVFCKKDTNALGYFKRNEIRNEVTPSNIKESCRTHGRYHNFYENAGYRPSILPPSKQSDWCYFDIFYKTEGDPNNAGERIYVGVNNTCSNGTKWELKKESKSGEARHLFRYYLKGNESGKKNNFWSQGPVLASF